MPKIISKKRTRLSAIQKKSIQEKKKANPNLLDEEIAAEFDCDRSTVSKILKQNRWSEVQEVSKTANALKIGGPKFPQVEKALEMWIGTAEQRKLILTGDVIRQKALNFAMLLDVPEEEFKASQGWLSRFKARIGLRNRRIHGEAESAPVEFLPQFREELKNILAAYEPRNIFNADECGLYYRIDSNISLSTAARRGRKRDKKRITVLCTANVDGTEKLTPLVINQSNMPHAFRNAGITSHNQLPVSYHYNEKAWMRQDIFKKFLRSLQSKFQIQQRKILLLVDNASSHAVGNFEEYPNICVHFLPANTTAHLQPMDAGVINAFKAHYKRLYIRQVIHDFDEGIEEPNKIDVLQALRIVKTAWEAVSAETIKNCWRHTGILPFQHLVEVFSDPAIETQNIQISEIITAQHEAQDIIDLTSDTNLQKLTQEYLDDDEPITTEEVMDDDRIIECVRNPEVYNNSPDDPEEPGITFAEARKNLNQLLKFIRQHPLQPDGFIKENDETFFRDFLSRTYRAAVKVMKQSTLEDFLAQKQI